MTQLTNAQVRLEVEKAEARFEELYPDAPTSGPGRRATIRSMAMKHVAEKLDVPLGTVQTKWRRAATTPRAKTKRERENFDYLGVEVSELYRKMLGRVLSGIQNTLGHLSSAKSAIAALAATQPFPEPKLKQWLGEFDALYQRTKGLIPVGVCPWCKNTKTYRDECVACFGTGYMLRHQAHAVPARLKEPGLIIQNGHEKRVKDLGQAADEAWAESTVESVNTPDPGITKQEHMITGVPFDKEPILPGDADNGDPLPW